MKITIAAVGKMKQGAMCDLFESYRKMLPWEIILKEVEEKRPLPVEKLKQREAEMLLEAIPQRAKKIILDGRGKELSSKQLSERIADWQNDGSSELAFLIGGADGHGEEIIAAADFTLSLGKMTWPHMLVRIMLAEQLYRAWSILHSHPYHR